jgi:hypothetical protein
VTLVAVQARAASQARLVQRNTLRDNTVNLLHVVPFFRNIYPTSKTSLCSRQ